MPKPFKEYPNQEIVTEEKPKLTAAEQAQVDQLLEKFGFKQKADD